MEYGQKFIFKDQVTGESLSDRLSFKFGITPETPLIFIKDYGDGTFMYCSKYGQHTRESEALKYCESIETNPTVNK